MQLSNFASSSSNLLELWERSSIVGSNEVIWEVFLLESVSSVEFNASLEIVLGILKMKYTHNKLIFLCCKYKIIFR